MAVTQKPGGSGELTIQFQGLACAHCAGKIEEEVRKHALIEQASLSFATQRMRVYLAENTAASQALRAIQEIARKIEPEVTAVMAEEAEEPDAAGRAHEQERGATQSQRGEWIRLGAALALFAFGLLLGERWMRTAVLVAVYLVSGYDVLLRAAKNILRGKIFDENFLMAVASVSAMALGEYAEGVAVMIFYQVGEAFQERAVGRSRRSIAALLNIRPEVANVVKGDAVRAVKPEQVAVGAVLQVKPGERVPLDGVVLRGRATLDTSALTGESMPSEVGEGDEVLSGCVSRDGLLQIRVTRVYGESTVAKILDMVEHAGERKTRTERFITRFARVYTPVVVLAAVALAIVPPLVLGGDFSTWIHRGLTFLVVSCPCALVISVPLGYFGGIGAASRAGILCKGSDALDALCALRAMVFDKTGTLTQGKFVLSKAAPAAGIDEVDLLHAAAAAEQASNHPIAESILRAAQGAELPAVLEAEEIAGHGVRVEIEGHTLLAGNAKLMARYGVATEALSLPGSVIYVARDGRYLGALAVEDAIKPDASAALAEMKRQGIRVTVMLTGDRAEVARDVAARVGIDEVHAQLLPGDKLELFEGMLAEPHAGKIGFVGDGINDAPVLARADVGIAMGGLGADAAIEAADVVLMTDQPGKIAAAMRIARGTRRIVTQNIALALGIKAIVLALSAVGLANMWAAVFADVGVSILAIFNAMRAMRVR